MERIFVLFCDQFQFSEVFCQRLNFKVIEIETEWFGLNKTRCFQTK